MLAFFVNIFLYPNIYYRAKIAEVALSVGYDCQLAFPGAFRKYTGVSPSEYRENKKCHTLV